MQHIVHIYVTSREFSVSILKDTFERTLTRIQDTIAELKKTQPADTIYFLFPAGSGGNLPFTLGKFGKNICTIDELEESLLKYIGQ